MSWSLVVLGGGVFAELEIVFDGGADLHFDFFVHLFSQPVLVAHNDEESDSEQSRQNKHEKHHAYHDFVCCRSDILNAAFWFFEAHFSADGGLKFVLIVDFQLR